MFDVAKLMGIPYHSNDLGITFAVWGFAAGPYVIVPVLGPSNPRDLVAQVGDGFADPGNYVAGTVHHYLWAVVARTATAGIDERSRNIESLADIERTALDNYATIRSLYRQRREAQIRHEQSKPAQPDVDSGRRRRGRSLALVLDRQMTKSSRSRHMVRRCVAVGALLVMVLALAPPREARAQDASSFIATLGQQAIQVLGPGVPEVQRQARFRVLFHDDFRFARHRPVRSRPLLARRHAAGTAGFSLAVPGISRARL